LNSLTSLLSDLFSDSLGLFDLTISKRNLIKDLANRCDQRGDVLSSISTINTGSAFAALAEDALNVSDITVEPRQNFRRVNEQKG